MQKEIILKKSSTFSCEVALFNNIDLKLESGFLMDFDSSDYPSDIYHQLEDMFTMRSEVNKFISTIQSLSARLHQ